MKKRGSSDYKKDLKGDSFLRCPNNHILPNRCVNGECTPVFCPTNVPTVNNVNHPIHRHDVKIRGELIETSSDADAEIDAILPPEAKGAIVTTRAQKAEELINLSHAAGRNAARKAFFKIPKGLEGAEAEAWAQAKAVSLLPDALAEIEYQLKLGDNGERRDAARDILDINGMRKRESVGNAGATIILNLGNKELPWAQKVIEHVKKEDVQEEDA